MVYCVAACCNSDTTKHSAVDGLHFHAFPKDPTRRKAWIVRCRRLESWKPGARARICSKHFAKEAYVRHPDLFKSIGFQSTLKPLLKEDAIPTIFADIDTAGQSVEGRKRSAVEKRNRQEAIASAMSAVSQFSQATQMEEKNEEIITAAPWPCASNVPLSEPSSPTTTDWEDISSNSELQYSTVGTQVGSSVSMRFAKSVQVCIHSRTNKSTQTTASRTKEIGIQVDGCPSFLKSDVATQTSIVAKLDDDSESDKDGDDMDVSFEAKSIHDEDWQPTMEDNLQEECDITLDLEMEEEIPAVPSDFTPYETRTPQSDRKFVVFESCLRVLFTLCHLCQGPCKVASRTVGTALMIVAVCDQGHEREWTSQPFHGQLPLGNLLLAAGIFFSGASPVRAVNSLHNVGVAMFHIRTYFTIQSLYLVQCVQRVWDSQQKVLIKERRRKQLVLAGDARCCSPGHTAKYGSYSLMDVSTEKAKVLDTSLVQCNEVKNSYWMELQGLKRCLQYLVNEKKLIVSSLVTDRHSQIKKYMRTNWPGIKHWFDCWHVAKGVRQKMETLAKKKKKLCGVLGDWAHSVSNQIYWIAATSDGDGELVMAKWLSVLNHVVDKHDGHGSLYPACLHEPLDDRAWLKEGSKAHKELELIVKQKCLLNDIGQLSPSEQTSALESYHKVVCFFAPKSRHFFFESMKARLLLATLHFNENSNRTQRVRKDGVEQWAISYPKAKAGSATAKQKKVDLTYGYIETLLDELMKLRDENPSYRLAKTYKDRNAEAVPGPVCSKYEKCNKAEVVADLKSRFNNS